LRASAAPASGPGLETRRLSLPLVGPPRPAPVCQWERREECPLAQLEESAGACRPEQPARQQPRPAPAALPEACRAKSETPAQSRSRAKLEPLVEAYRPARLAGVCPRERWERLAQQQQRAALRDSGEACRSEVREWLAHSPRPAPQRPEATSPLEAEGLRRPDLPGRQAPRTAVRRVGHAVRSAGAVSQPRRLRQTRRRQDRRRGRDRLDVGGQRRRRRRRLSEKRRPTRYNSIAVEQPLIRHRANSDRKRDSQHWKQADFGGRGRRRQIAPIVVFDVDILERRRRWGRSEIVEDVDRLLLIKPFVGRRREDPRKSPAENPAAAGTRPTAP
jgi:hypothetical protein